MARINKWVFTAVIPFVIALAAAVFGVPLLNLLCFFSHFVLLRFVPLFKGRESLWMFLMTALSSIPVNAAFLAELGTYGRIFYPTLLPLGILRGALYFLVLFSVEELIMGVITRLIWKRQLRNLF